MWTVATRAQDKREGWRVAGDLTAAEWALLGQLLPPRRKFARPQARPMREIANAMFHMQRGGVPLADAAALLSTAPDGLRLVRRAAQWWSLAEHQPPGDARPGTGVARSG